MTELSLKKLIGAFCTTLWAEPGHINITRDQPRLKSMAVIPNQASNKASAHPAIWQAHIRDQSQNTHALIVSLQQ